MPKINREEYETLTELSDKWKWIATDGDDYVWGYENRPKKLGGAQLWDDLNGGQYKYLGPNLFQFIQWEDEEPYSIDELIDEYEEAIRVNSQIDKLAKFIMSEVEGEPSQSEDAVDTAIRIIKSYQNQETLPKVWVDEHAEYYGPIGYPVVPVNDLQNLPRSEQKGLEVKIYELIEKYEKEDGKHSNWENSWIDEFLTDLENLTGKKEKVPKYYVDLDAAAYVARWVGDSRVQIYTDSISGDDEYELHLTEQEIKDYDPRFWLFAVEVRG